MLTIHDRSASAAERIEAGHWARDPIIGKEVLSAIGTLDERLTRMVRLLHVPRRDGTSVRRAVAAWLKDLSLEMLPSITWDQGTEMPRHSEMTRAGVLFVILDHRGNGARTRT